mmetsp:Transcript_5190/g.32591  ORF Transcript_5190/g.32591 Transcript_5190/m.32591 type:complete len:111 (-) Transcript_5190:1680-2012(-)
MHSLSFMTRIGVWKSKMSCVVEGPNHAKYKVALLKKKSTASAGHSEGQQACCSAPSAKYTRGGTLLNYARQEIPLAAKIWTNISCKGKKLFCVEHSDWCSVWHVLFHSAS